MFKKLQKMGAVVVGAAVAVVATAASAFAVGPFDTITGTAIQTELGTWITWVAAILLVGLAINLVPRVMGWVFAAVNGRAGGSRR